MASTKVLTFKLFIDNKEHKVLFAEAGKDVVDFLFSILALPVGTVIRLLKTEGMVGTLGNLYNSIQDLNSTYMLPDKNGISYKGTLLKPEFAIPTTIMPILLSYVGNGLFRCPQCFVHFSDDPKAICPRCRFSINSNVCYPLSNEGGFVKGAVKYMIMDDLSVKPMSAKSILDLMNEFKVKDVGVIKEKEINLSINEGLKMLKASFMTQTVLTHVFGWKFCSWWGVFL